MNEIYADIVSVTPLSDTVLQLFLKPDDYIDYLAGQYLQIVTQHDAFSYSIANAPLGSRQYELHIRHSRDNLNNQSLLASLKRQGRVLIRLPLGQCDINQLHIDKPIVFIAAGSGFAPIKAMIEQLLADGDPRHFELYWGARSQGDLYMDDKVMQWKKRVSHFDYYSHLSELNKNSLVSKVFRHHPHDLENRLIVMSGPFEMMYEMRDALIAKGISKHHIFSDAFHFES